MNIMEINARIKETRATIGISQAKFAKRIAISHSYLAEMEGYRKPASERIIRLIIAEFNINGHWLRTGNGSMFNDEFDAETAKLLNAFKSLSPSFKACALKQMDELAALNDESTNPYGIRGERIKALIFQ